MTIQKSFGLAESEENRRLLAQISRLCKVSGKSFSEITREALAEYADKYTRLMQTRLDTFKNPFEEQLDRMHAEFVHPNPKGYGTWEECLQREGLLCEQSIQYSLDKGWKITNKQPPLGANY